MQAPPIKVRAFGPDDTQSVFDVILPIQRDEFGIAITAADQPDLLAIPDFYQNGAGGFWVAIVENRVAGTIGLKDIGNAQAALRKMFVSAPYRGKEHGIAGRLLQTLIDHAKREALAEIFLGTTDKFLAAHRFYEKNGFAEIAKANLPPAFPVMAVDSKFYVRDLSK
ncbi:MAG: GNAT family N-acetyltransferase [Pseudomonadota bacterium]|jgi:N-acetylglutamate synthase-like GNAT family acetyltransferase